MHTGAAFSARRKSRRLRCAEDIMPYTHTHTESVELAPQIATRPVCIERWKITGLSPMPCLTCLFLSVRRDSVGRALSHPREPNA